MVLVQSASHEIGTGIQTVAAEMAAEQLGVELDNVKVEMGDSALPPAPVSDGSNSTASVFSAVMLACPQLVEAAVEVKGGPLEGVDSADLKLQHGSLVARDGRSQSVADVFKRLGSGALEEYAEFIPDGAPPDALQQLYDGKGMLVGTKQRPKAQRHSAPSSWRCESTRASGR